MIAGRRALVETSFGIVTVDLETEEVVGLEPGEPLSRPVVDGLALPLLVTADALGSRVVAIVDRKPPLLVSDDSGATWRESGGGLPPGRAIAIAPDHPDLVLYASETRLFLSQDGGRFWRSLEPELEGVEAAAWEE